MEGGKNVCSGCINAERIKALEEGYKDLSHKVNSIEKESAITRTQTEMIFKILNEIKESIKTIENKIENRSIPSNLEQRLAVLEEKDYNKIQSQLNEKSGSERQLKFIIIGAIITFLSGLLLNIIINYFIKGGR